MKIMLLYPKWVGAYGVFACFAKKASVWPPLNLAYLSALAEKEGHQVRILDGQVEDMSLEKMIEQAEAVKPDIIGITATTPFYHIVCDLAKGLKRANNKIPIIIGGTHITMLKEEAFYPFFDYAFVGESDESWPEFLERYENGGDISRVKGILFRHDGEIEFTGMPKPVDDIDSIPLPARHLLKMDKYKIGTLQGTKNFTTILTIRGCPFKCIFCSTKVFGSKVRKRSPRLVIEEIKSVIDKYDT